MSESGSRPVVESGVSSIAAAVQRGETSAVEVLEAFLERISAIDGQLGAFVRLDRSGAHEQAEAIDSARGRGDQLGPLAGVPFALKDNIARLGQPLTCGSRILEGYVSPYEATAVARLVAAGAVPVGHTNMDEFGMGSSCETSVYGPTRNPWRLDLVPGGSSGGSAAAVASGSVPFALGSDTGGSIRQPAALCGVVGVKPTYGSVSRYGLVAFASSLDQIGPITGDVRDAAAVLCAIAGPDPADATSANRSPADFVSECQRPVDDVRVAVPREIDADRLEPDVRAAWAEALAALARAGARIEEVSVPALSAANAVYYVLANCEASANLARFEGVRYGARDVRARTIEEVYFDSRSAGFGDEVKRRILLGTFALSSGYYDAYYARASAVAAGLRDQLAEVLRTFDHLAMPTSPTPAWPLGERLDDPLAMYLSDVYTVSASLTGLPAIAVPAGLSGDGLPLSLQLVGRPFQEGALLATAARFEHECAFRRPRLPATTESESGAES